MKADVVPRRKRIDPVCAAPGCDRPTRCRVNGMALCGLHEDRMRKHISLDLPEKTAKDWSLCSVGGCDNRARTRSGSLCEKHYYRQYLHGSTDEPPEKDKSAKPTSHGYAYLRLPDHPITPKSGTVYEHRVVLYDEIGPGVHKCYWCDSEIDWSGTGESRLVVDHLDNDKLNNSITNLKPSCHKCNSNRGLLRLG